MPQGEQLCPIYSQTFTGLSPNEQKIYKRKELGRHPYGSFGVYACRRGVGLMENLIFLSKMRPGGIQSGAVRGLAGFAARRGLRLCHAL